MLEKADKKWYNITVKRKAGSKMINIGSHRELFTDDFIVDTQKTTVPTVYNQPRCCGRVFLHDAPWEEFSGYHSMVLRPEGGAYMYYKTTYTEKSADGSESKVNRFCLLESEDGLSWRRAELDITPIDGYPVNNIITGRYDYYDNLFFYYDTNPDCPENERYKATYGEWGNALFGYKSADGIHYDFHPEGDREIEYPPVFVEHPPLGDPRRNPALLMSTAESHCFFDSLNTCMYMEELGGYVALVRGFHAGDDLFPVDNEAPDALRDVRVSYSSDMVHWSFPKLINYGDDGVHKCQVGGSSAIPYFRAPHIIFAMPGVHGGAVSDRPFAGGFFMAGRDGLNWQIADVPLLPPDQTGGRRHVPCIGMMQTRTSDDAQPALSFYCRAMGGGAATELFRYEIRLDGFAEKRAEGRGSLVTKPFTFDGSELEINFAASENGYIKLTLLAEDGTAIHSCELRGDDVAHTVGFADGSVADFAGKNVVLEAEMSDASFYSFKFNR